MLNWYIVWTVQQEHYRDLVCQAERQRRIRAVLAGRRPRSGRLDRGLVELGGWLVAAGQRLQARSCAGVVSNEIEPAQ